ncbi:MAG TPA: hypothetical protein VNN55_12580 [bacterium]|nr:hypothetical protein [bacterium]
MHVVKSRWLALAVLCLSLVYFAGCQIDGSTGTTGALTHVRVSPDLNLHAAPEGYMYQLWLVTFQINEVDTSVTPEEPVSLARFRWDPYLYAASDENGEFLPLTTGNGMPIGFDVTPYLQGINPVAFITLEPINDPHPDAPDGPFHLVFNINPQSGRAVLINPFALVPLLTQTPPIVSFNLISQSNKKGIPGAQWRDNETEGQGIWFANPRLEDETTLDSAGGWDAYIKTFVPPSGGAYNYVVWIGRAHPESSFSNFGLVMPQREPDFEFRDGNPSHAPGKYGPDDPIPLAPGVIHQGVELGEDPVIIDGEVVGYRYIINNPLTQITDTCVIRIDDPSLTRCNRDTFQVLSFDEQSVLPRAFRITNGDTIMGPTMSGVLDLSDPDALNEILEGNAFIFAGWEYEAWLVFTKASGIPPISLGRFKGPLGADSKNPYTFTDDRFDRNFMFPGEDFLHDLPYGLQAPLDVLESPVVEKLWITIEPDDDFMGAINFDWAPDEPNTQLIYMSAFFPDDLDTVGTTLVPMIYRDLNPTPTGLNEGNFFPTVTVQFLPPPAE